MKIRKLYILLIALMYGILFNLGNAAMPSYTNSLDITQTYVGLYLASTGLGLFVFSTLWGALGDIKNRDKVLAIVFLGYGIGQLLFGLFRTPNTLLFASLFSGVFFAGILVNLYSYINDSFADIHDRNKMLSYAVSLFLAGGAFAYLLGGYVTDFVAPNYHIVYYIQAALLIGFSVFIYISKVDLVDTDHHLSRVYFWGVFKQVFQLPWVPIYTLTLTFMVSFAHQNVRRFIDYYVIDSGKTPTQMGYIVFTAGLVALVANVFIAPFFLKRMHTFRFLQIQFILAPILLYLSFQTQNIFIGLYTSYMGYTLILSVYEPTAISFMSNNKAVSQGVLVGVRQSIVGLGTTVGFVIGGILYEQNQLYVFYFSVLLYIIVVVGFSILIIIKKQEVRSYRNTYLKEGRTND